VSSAQIDVWPSGKLQQPVADAGHGVPTMSRRVRPSPAGEASSQMFQHVTQAVLEWYSVLVGKTSDKGPQDDTSGFE
jgi:hypothetical protein